MDCFAEREQVEFDVGVLDIIDEDVIVSERLPVFVTKIVADTVDDTTMDKDLLALTETDDDTAPLEEKEIIGENDSETDEDKVQSSDGSKLTAALADSDA